MKGQTLSIYQISPWFPSPSVKWQRAVDFGPISSCDHHSSRCAFRDRPLMKLMPSVSIFLAGGFSLRQRILERITFFAVSAILSDPLYLGACFPFFCVRPNLKRGLIDRCARWDSDLPMLRLTRSCLTLDRPSFDLGELISISDGGAQITRFLARRGPVRSGSALGLLQ